MVLLVLQPLPLEKRVAAGSGPHVVESRAPLQRDALRGTGEILVPSEGIHH